MMIVMPSTGKSYPHPTMNEFTASITLFDSKTSDGDEVYFCPKCDVGMKPTKTVLSGWYCPTCDGFDYATATSEMLVSVDIWLGDGSADQFNPKQNIGSVVIPVLARLIYHPNESPTLDIEAEDVERVIDAAWDKLPDYLSDAANESIEKTNRYINLQDKLEGIDASGYWFGYEEWAVKKIETHDYLYSEVVPYDGEHAPSERSVLRRFYIKAEEAVIGEEYFPDFKVEDLGFGGEYRGEIAYVTEGDIVVIEAFVEVGLVFVWDFKAIPADKLPNPFK